MDAAASQWVLGFLNLLRADVMAALRASNATRPQAEAWADAQDTLTDLQWGLLQGYIQSLVPTWGKIVMQGYLAGSGGGLVVTKTVDEFLYGALAARHTRACTCALQRMKSSACQSLFRPVRAK